MKKIYLDVCCLNRPFDDQSQDRIHLEAEAILLILRHIEAGEWMLMGSSVIDYEIEQTSNVERKRRIKQLANQASHYVLLTNDAVERGEQIKAISRKDYPLAPNGERVRVRGR